MGLITLENVKKYFPLHSSYAVDDEGAASDTVLQNEVDMAEDELQSFVSVTEETINDAITFHLLNIIRYNCFKRKHGDTEFDSKPAIVKDYERTIQTLKDHQSGTINLFASASDEVLPKVHTKTRQFGENYSWFTPDWP